MINLLKVIWLVENTRSLVMTDFHVRGSTNVIYEYIVFIVVLFM